MDTNKDIKLVGFLRLIIIWKQGRGNDADIRISDISVSRNHALLKVEKDNVTLHDLHSKFGTLVLANDFHVMEVNKPTVLQVGRTVFEAMVEEQVTKKGCCTNPELDETVYIADIPDINLDSEVWPSLWLFKWELRKGFSFGRDRTM